MEMVKKTDSDSSMCGVNRVREDEIEDLSTGNITVYMNKEALYHNIHQKYGFNIAVWNKLYKSNIIKKLHFPKNKLYEDIMYTTEALYMAKK